MDLKDPLLERAMGESLPSALLHSTPVSSTIKSKNRRKKSAGAARETGRLPIS